jgi:V/A-type H+-transporting ATPase subunit E
MSNVKIKNGLAAIANEVIGDVLKEAENAITKAQADAEHSLRMAKAEADQIYKTTIEEALAKTEIEKRRIASLTEVELRNQQLQFKEALVNDAFRKANERLEEFAVSSRYQEYLVGLIESTIKKIGSNDLTLFLNQKDKSWVTIDLLQKRLGTKSKINLMIAEETEQFLGGCKIQALGGKLSLDNSFDNQLQNLRTTLRVDVSRILFEKETKQAVS